MPTSPSQRKISVTEKEEPCSTDKLKSSQQETNCLEEGEIPEKSETSVTMETNQIPVVVSNDVRTNQVDLNTFQQQFTYDLVSLNLIILIFLTILKYLLLLSCDI